MPQGQALRDPFLLSTTDGRSWLVYAGGDEKGIGLVELVVDQ
jgi:hypothetical protein